MAVPIDPTSAGFLFAENRQMPMHVGGLQLFEKPEGAPRDYARKLYETDVAAGRDVPAVPEATDPRHHHGGPVGLDPGRQLRPRVPLPAQRAAQAGTDPRAARPVLAPAQHPPGPGAAAVGGAPDRGDARRPGRALHEAAPLPGRRHLGDAADAERDDHRPRQARHAADVGGAAGQEDRRPGTRQSGSLAAVPLDAMRSALGITADAAGLPGALVKTLKHGPEERDLGALALRPPHDVQHHDHRLTPLRRRGLADRATAGHRQGQRHHPQRRRARHVLRRDPQLPARARLAAGLHAGLDGPGRAATPSGPGRPPAAATPSVR